MTKNLDFTGQKFGRLTIIKYAGRDKHRHNMWLCECDCGNKTTIRDHSFRSGKTKSCSCLNKEINSI